MQVSSAATIFCIEVLGLEASISRGQLNFWFDSHGVIRWVNLTENIAVRARPEQALAAFDEQRGD